MLQSKSLIHDYIKISQGIHILFLKKKSKGRSKARKILHKGKSYSFWNEKLKKELKLILKSIQNIFKY